MARVQSPDSRLSALAKPSLSAPSWPFFYENQTAFVLVCWMISRLVVLHGLRSVPSPNLGVVANWDGVWYRTIATQGYDFAADGRWHSIAFFPLYPYLVSLAMRAGANFDLASVLVSNAAYLAMMIVTSHWVAKRNGHSAARWTSAFLAFFPLSLFGSVAYPEGLFMLLSALALKEFDERRYPASALWSALAALARPNGVCLCVAFAASALAERRGKGAMLPAITALLGALVMITFGAVRFHDPLAFIHAQQAWRHGIGGGLTEWRILLSSGSVSFGHWRLKFVHSPHRRGADACGIADPLGSSVVPMVGRRRSRASVLGPRLSVRRHRAARRRGRDRLPPSAWFGAGRVRIRFALRSAWKRQLHVRRPLLIRGAAFLARDRVALGTQSLPRPPAYRCRLARSRPERRRLRKVGLGRVARGCP